MLTMPQALEDTVTNRPCVSSTYESLIMVGGLRGLPETQRLAHETAADTM